MLVCFGARRVYVCAGCRLTQSPDFSAQFPGRDQWLTVVLFGFSDPPSHPPSLPHTMVLVSAESEVYTLFPQKCVATGQTYDQDMPGE